MLLVQRFQEISDLALEFGDALIASLFCLYHLFGSFLANLQMFKMCRY